LEQFFFGSTQHFRDRGGLLALWNDPCRLFAPYRLQFLSVFLSQELAKPLPRPPISSLFALGHLAADLSEIAFTFNSL
jgi:hypothetical protein